jgi:CubicO group peptidase (beta-lactamase class C family)
MVPAAPAAGPYDAAMLRCRPTLALALVLACACRAAEAPAPAAPPPPLAALPDQAALDALLRPAIGEGRLVAAIACVVNAETRIVAAAGAAPGQAVPEGDTLFEIGSITKVFTSLLLADAALRGELGLGDEAAAVLGSAAPRFEGAPIRLIHLATHTSGLARLPLPFVFGMDPADPYRHLDAGRLTGYLGAVALERAPGARYEYSNLGPGVLELALVRRLGQPFGALIDARIAARLGLVDTALEPGASLAARLIDGHDERGAPTPHWTFGAMAGAGALRGSAADLARLLAAELRAAAGQVGPLGDAMRLTQRPFAVAGGGQRIGLGWHIAPSGVRWHNGGTGGFASFAAFDPAVGVGVVVLAASARNDLVDPLGKALLDLAQRAAGPAAPGVRSAP